MGRSRISHVSLPFYQSNKAAGQRLGGFGGQAAAAPEADGEEEPAVLAPSAVNTQESGTSGKAVPSGKENALGRQRKGREYRKSDLEVNQKLFSLIPSSDDCCPSKGEENPDWLSQSALECIERTDKNISIPKVKVSQAESITSKR